RPRAAFRTTPMECHTLPDTEAGTPRLTSSCMGDRSPFCGSPSRSLLWVCCGPPEARLPRSSHWRSEMSATLATIAGPEITKKPDAASLLFSACRNGIERYFVRRAAVASLRELDDRVLLDIGLEWSQIQAAAYGFLPRSDRATMRS